MRYVLLFVLLLARLVHAGEATLSCTAPTQNEDGTPLIDLDGFKFYYGLTDGGPYPSEVDQPNENICGTVITDLSAGIYYFVATAYNAAGVESDLSNQASKTIASQPQPPGNLVVIGDLTAYSISQSLDAFITYPVGTVPIGTECDETQSANGLHRVPVSAVDFAGGGAAWVTFAECGSG